MDMSGRPPQAQTYAYSLHYPDRLLDKVVVFHQGKAKIQRFSHFLLHTHGIPVKMNHHYIHTARVNHCYLKQGFLGRGLATQGSQY